MHTVYLFDSEKGGVGKSTFCKVFVQYLIDNGVDFKLFDADFTNQDVLSAYSDIGGEALNLAKDERLGLDADKIFAAARDTNVVVNFPANIAIIFNRWLEQTGVLEMQKAREMRFVKIFVTTHEFSCIQALKKSLNQWGKSMSHVVVQNIHTAYQETYDEVFGEAELAKLIKKYHVPILSMERLSPAVINILNEHQLRLDAAMKADESVISILNQMRIQTWQSGCHKQIASSRVVTIPKKTSAKAEAQKDAVKVQ